MIKFKLIADSEYIELIKLLKATKNNVEDGQVKLNGQIESRKRAKLRKGDKIEVFDKIIIIE